MSHDAAPLFAGWEKGMILSCLQGHMGQVRTGGGHPPESALCAIGDFCFFAGRPDPALVRQADRPLLVPRTGDWAPVIRAVWGRRAVPFLRYALCGAPEDFDRDRLAAFAAALPPGFSLSPILAGHYPLLTAQDWSPPSSTLSIIALNSSKFLPISVPFPAIVSSKTVVVCSGVKV